MQRAHDGSPGPTPARWRPRRPATLLLVVAAGAWACGGGNTGAGEAAESRGEASVAPEPARPPTTGLDSAALARVIVRADSLPRLRCLVIARHGEILEEYCREGYTPGSPANVKSVSKSVLSALVGVAIAEGHLEGADQPALPFLETHLDTVADPRKREITIGHLLSMQSGLERTSGGNYGAWVSSAHWVRNAIRRRMDTHPGGRMLYSTGNYHLLSSILTTATGVSTMEYARSRLGEPLDIIIPRWPTDPQGIYFGGNDMRLSPRAMIRFGELFRAGGIHDGREIVPAEWVRESLRPRTRSPWSGEEYGYGWFLGRTGDHPMFYAWGYGGQFIFVVPDLELTVATTSDPAAPRGGGHIRAIHTLLDDWIVPAAEIGAGLEPAFGRTDAHRTPNP